ncbi:CCN family member 4 isoform X2 [Manis pentadactyla]|uniref:CCN family member 4 isoform X2 n=1 Tax=Manis pentadactyla TaxID=143292 RepID=UPI00255CBE56|nr:CCN family member 4 isoform X2 [Manis pentadactyla]
MPLLLTSRHEVVPALDAGSSDGGGHGPLSSPHDDGLHPGAAGGHVFTPPILQVAILGTTAQRPPSVILTGASTATTAGTAREVVGVGCVLDGVHYTNGQSFQPNCKYNCTCVDGAVGCTPLCLRARPPRLWCSHPRQVSLPGHCCQQWVCDNNARRTRKTAQRHTGAFAAAGEVETWQRNCIAYRSPWSPCSATCGLGVSTRISSANARCWPEQESRLCNLRPCDLDIRPHIKEGKKCLAVYQPEAPMNFTLAGCISMCSYRPKYCGVCVDNRCCIPYKSKTISVSFQCPDGPGFSRQVLWINACFCNLSCRNPNDIFADLESYPDFSEIAN